MKKHLSEKSKCKPFLSVVTLGIFIFLALGSFEDYTYKDGNCLPGHVTQ